MSFLRAFVLVCWVCVVAGDFVSPNDQAAALRANVDHIVIFMQENRAFDHYYGMLNGVRGFNDRVSIPIVGQPTSFYQPVAVNTTNTTYMLPFRVDINKTSASCMDAPDMSYICDIAMWNQGRYDQWNMARNPGFGMSHWTREDLPYYYTLFDNFLVGDQYFQATFTETNPNRLHLFSGSNGLSAGFDAVLNNDEDVGREWQTVAEGLQAINVSWKVYQEMDNFDDNGFAWFATFKNATAGNPLFDRGMARSSDAIEDFGKDLAAGNLPQVSWVIAPTAKSEHAANHPSAGEDFTARLLQKLQAHPDIYARTVFILNYDEGGQFFDHHHSPTPPVSEMGGMSTVSVQGEINTKFWTSVPAPIGLGFRVPMLVVSPWTRGRLVLSHTLDHTSVIRLLEQRFPDYQCPNISPWRRAVTGDFLAAFDFAHPDYTWPDLPDTSDYVHENDVACSTLPKPTRPTVQSMPVQEGGTRVARALSFAIKVSDTLSPIKLALTLNNVNLDYGAALSVFDEVRLTTDIPRQYALAPNTHVTDYFVLNTSGIAYALSLHGPNGFCRQLAARVGDPAANVAAVDFTEDGANGQVRLVLSNKSPSLALRFTITDHAYGLLPQPLNIEVAPRSQATQFVSLLASSFWYDLSVRAVVVGQDPSALGSTGCCPTQSGVCCVEPCQCTLGTSTTTSVSPSGFWRRYLGHVETGKDSTSDPAMASGVAVATSAIAGLNGDVLFVHPAAHPPMPIPDPALEHKYAYIPLQKDAIRHEEL